MESKNPPHLLGPLAESRAIVPSNKSLKAKQEIQTLLDEAKEKAEKIIDEAREKQEKREQELISIQEKYLQKEEILEMKKVMMDDETVLGQ